MGSSGREPGDGGAPVVDLGLVDVALGACKAANGILLDHFSSPKLRVDRKRDGTPVTEADRAAESAIRAIFSRETPDLGVLGEEFGVDGNARSRWIVDPLDGTKNFAAGIPMFATLIALEVDGRMEIGVVHAPVTGETWWAARGLGAFSGRGTDRVLLGRRRLEATRCDGLSEAFVCHGGLTHFARFGMWEGFASIVPRLARTRGFGDYWGHALVASGRADAMVDPVVRLYDIAPFCVIVEEAGGRWLTRNGATLDTEFEGPFVTCAPGLARILGNELGLEA